MLDGLLTFSASHHAIRADKVLTAAGMTTRLVPGPKDLSPNCGTAVRFEHDRRDLALEVLSAKNVEIDSVMEYRPRTDQWEAASRPRRWRRSR